MVDGFVFWRCDFMGRRLESEERRAKKAAKTKMGTNSKDKVALVFAFTLAFELGFIFILRIKRREGVDGFA